MSTIAIIDLISVVICLVGLTVLLINNKVARWHDARLVLVTLMLVKLCYCLCMLIEWSGLNLNLERLEDFFGAMLPLCWAFAFYAFVQEIMARDIQQSQDRLNQALDATKTGAWHFNPITQEVESGTRWFATLGYAPHECPQNYDAWLKLIHPEDLQSVQETLETFLKHKPDTYESRFRLHTKDGSWRWIYARGRLLETDQGQQYMSGTQTDITQQVLAEMELETYRNHLEELVEKRTSELAATQDKLIRSERLAALGQLTATVAHEIRNPLGTIRNSVFSMGDASARQQTDRFKRAQALAEKNIKRCDHIIQDLLDYSRKREPVLIHTHLDTWILECLHEIKIPEGIELSHTLSAQTDVLIDTEHLYRVLSNALLNAFQSFQESDNANKHVHIVTCKTDTRIEIQIMDTGVGIPEQVMKKIYEPLFSTKTFGVGLGVPIIRNIMEEHGGGVEYNSQEGKGTTVTLWLPLPDKQGERA